MTGTLAFVFIIVAVICVVAGVAAVGVLGAVLGALGVTGALPAGLVFGGGLSTGVARSGGATEGGPEARRARAMRSRAASRTTTTTPMTMKSAVIASVPSLRQSRPPDESRHAGSFSIWRSTFWLTTWDEPPGAIVTP